MIGHGEKWTRKADALVAALLVQPNVESAAKAAGVSIATARRWSKRQEFSERYAEARREVMRAVIAEVQGAAREAVACLREICQRGEVESARVSAAKSLLDMALRAVELEDLEKRITRLEQGEKEAMK